MSLSIHGSLQDELEVARLEDDNEENVAAVGTLFNEHAAAFSFDEYTTYAQNYDNMVKTLEAQFKTPWVHNYFKV